MGEVNAQSTDDARVINLTILPHPTSPDKLIIHADKTHALHNEIIFNLSTPVITPIICTPENQIPFVLTSGLNQPIVFSPSEQPVTHQIAFNVQGYYESNFLGVTLKPTFSTGASGYVPPDETWNVATTATWTPTVEGAYPLTLTRF